MRYIFYLITSVSTSLIDAPPPQFGFFTRLHRRYKEINHTGNKDNDSNIRFIMLKNDYKTDLVVYQHFSEYLDDKNILTTAFMNLFSDKTIDVGTKDAIVRKFIKTNISLEWIELLQCDESFFSGCSYLFDRINFTGTYQVFHFLKQHSVELNSNINFLRILENEIKIYRSDLELDVFLFTTSCKGIVGLLNVLISKGLMSSCLKQALIIALYDTSGFLDNLEVLKIKIDEHFSLINLEDTTLSKIINYVFNTKFLEELNTNKRKIIKCFDNILLCIQNHRKDVSGEEATIKMLSCLFNHVIIVLDLAATIVSFDENTTVKPIKPTHKLSYAFGNLTMSLMMVAFGFENPELYKEFNVGIYDWCANITSKDTTENHIKLNNSELKLSNMHFRAIKINYNNDITDEMYMYKPSWAYSSDHQDEDLDNTGYDEINTMCTRKELVDDSNEESSLQDKNIMEEDDDLHTSTPYTKSRIKSKSFVYAATLVCIIITVISIGLKHFHFR